MCAVKDKDMKKILYRIILWTWCLPQTLLGLAVYLYVKLVDKELSEGLYRSGTHLVRTEKLGAGLSLGLFVFSYDYEDAGKIWPEAQDRMDRHEWGHTLQGFLLGPLYLFIIGAPSMWWAHFGKHNKDNSISYYSFYTERWADNWARVER